jgi:exodeoxyribonuclease V alpha subunit
MQIIGNIRYLKTHSHTWATGYVIPNGPSFRELHDLCSARRVAFSGEIAVVGEALAQLRVGGNYTFECEFSVHPKYGPQLKVFGASPHMGSGTAQLVAYLQQNFEGVGGLTAKKAVAYHEQAGTLDKFRAYVLSSPAQVDLTLELGRKSPAIYPARSAGTIFDAIAVLLSREFMPAQVRPGAWSGLARHLGRLADPAWDRYVEHTRKLSKEDAAKVEVPPVRPDRVDAALQMVRNDPYQAIEYKVRGYGFDEADRVGVLQGIKPEDPRRLSAIGAEAVTRKCYSGGHTYLTMPQFASAVASMDPMADPHEVLHLTTRATACRLFVEDGRVYVKELLEAENKAASALQRLLTQPGQPLGRAEGMQERLRAVEARMGIKLDDSQRNSLLSILGSDTRIHTITSGPGRGKTTVVQALVHEAEANGKVGMFAAPTGKAAKVLADRLKRAVSTVHRMLGANPFTGFEYGIRNPLPADFIVVDESSMLDIDLARAVFEAVAPGAHIILLGDDGQLPSVSPGRVLGDVLALPADRHVLEHTHRNKGHILRLIDRIGDGTLEKVVNTEDVTGIEAAAQSDEVVLRDLVDLYLTEVQAKGFENAALITPYRAGDAKKPGWNATYLNAAIQARVNAGGERLPGLPFVRVGDRVIVRQNVYAGVERETVVVNGDIGVLLSFELDQRGLLASIQLQLDNGERVSVTAASLDNPEDMDRVIDLGYALTVHAAQGSEYSTVVFAIQRHSSFVDRRMVYTAVSRAKNKLMVFGSPRAVAAAAHTEPALRQSMLAAKAGVNLELDRLLMRAKKGW